MLNVLTLQGGGLVLARRRPLVQVGLTQVDDRRSSEASRCVEVSVLTSLDGTGPRASGSAGRGRGPGQGRLRGCREVEHAPGSSSDGHEAQPLFLRS